jgi:hypothetical protein
VLVHESVEALLQILDLGGVVEIHDVSLRKCLSKKSKKSIQNLKAATEDTEITEKIDNKRIFFCRSLCSL